MRFVSAGDGWHALPLPDGVRSHPLCDAQYDPNMAAMLNERDGFWYMRDAPGSRLYLRQACVRTCPPYAPLAGPAAPHTPPAHAGGVFVSS